MGPSKCIKLLTVLCLILLIELVDFTKQEDGNFNENNIKKSTLRQQDSSSANEVENHQQDAFKSPFIVLMSDDSISVAQMPLIENGSLTVVYRLNGCIEGADGLNMDDEIADNLRDGDEDPSQEGDTNADAREYEQMPHDGLRATTLSPTSLGKSEWQQIATNDRSQEEVWPQQTKTTDTSRKEEDAQGTDRGPRGRARRSFLNLTDVAGNNRDTANAREDANAMVASRNESTSGQRGPNVDYSGDNNNKAAQTNQEKTGSVEESAAPDVTSAQSSASSERQANSDGARVVAEESDKNSRRIQLRCSDGSSSNLAKGPVGRLQFEDFDVHMSLGYAFVADSMGRIHRFKLLNSSAAIPKRVSHGDGVETAGGDGLPENDYTNTIDAGDGSKAEYSTHQSGPFLRFSGTQKGGSNIRTIFTNDEATLSMLNKVSDRRTDAAAAATFGDVTHEQPGDERQHPTTSGGGLKTATTRAPNDAPISGTSHPSRDENFRQDSMLLYYEAEPKIIWSRSKQSRSAAKFARTSMGTDDKGALPAKVNPNHQMANGTRLAQLRKSSKSQLLGRHDYRETTETTAGESEITNESTIANLGSTKKRSRKNPGRQFKTEVAVDWLNNLLFVLDKYRLIVVDFEGNNELVLIDDFNSNNRPVDLKVDPVNDFLFWLQIGKFHNTIYKLDLNVLSLPSANQRLVVNTLRLRQTQEIKSNHSGLSHGANFDQSELVALVSHHYAHPIITNLPKHARLFTIDHKHSRIYVPLGPVSKTNTDQQSNQTQDAEVFAPSDSFTTHLNNTDSLYSNGDGSDKNCTTNRFDQTNQASDGGQILAYNLDGTDVGPLREVGGRSHISSLDDMQDFSIDNERGLLYWLTNDGKELFEEYKDESKSIHPAIHNLDGRRYMQLMFFEQDGSNQPVHQKSRYNLRNLIQMLSNSLSSNRQTRDSYSEEPGYASSFYGRNSIDAEMTSLSKNAPFIILGVTILIVISVYLIYALMFQHNDCPDGRDNHCHNVSIEGSSVSGGSHTDTNTNVGSFMNTCTISRWLARPSVRSTTDASTLNRDLNSVIGPVESCDLESTIYDASNAVDEHYRASTINHLQSSSQFYDLETTNRLANLSHWPSNTHDMSNKLYIPVEVLQDEGLSSIHRVSIDQLEIERKAPLGEGHFGTVLQGSIKCTNRELTVLLSKSQSSYAPETASSTYQQRLRLPISSIGSSGHGSSSSTSCEFTTANNCTDATTTITDDRDYLTPKSQLHSAMSDYNAGENTTSSEAGSFSSYGNANVDISIRQLKNANNENKLKVAIKKLKDNASTEEKRDFLQEAKLLANFDHPNIVHLIGICLDRGSTLIVMELMLGGDLIRYMQENTPGMTNNTEDCLTEDDLLKICLDIVNGCCYLEELDYIHRDLAARNCLVSSRKRDERVVKLADFGLARDIYKDSYYKKLNDSAMPLKWMAPECLIEQKFTKKSDVWSFGVVMWEVMSYCQRKPYGEVEPFFMKEHLSSGARLRKPDDCDDNVYRLMNQCWQMEPNNRPTFHECRSMLIEIRSSKR